jgi:hypothetical protein
MNQAIICCDKTIFFSNCVFFDDILLSNPDAIKPRMTKEEVIRQIGEPDMSIEISGTRTLVYRCILRKTLFVDLDNSGFVKEIHRE